MEEDQVSVTIDNHEVPDAVSDCDESSSTSRPDPFEEFTLGGTMTRVEETSPEHDVLRKTFLACLGPHAVQVRVAAVHRKSIDGFAGIARLDAFRVFAKAVGEKCGGGDANLKFGWYGGSREEISQIVSHGFSRCSSESAGGVSHGVGIYLTPLKYLLHCVGLSVPDKYGLRHILLSRVIMGKSEVIPAGSKQYHPSTLEFDSGVDNLVSPRRFVVWDAFMNSHIFPLAIISFTGPPSFNIQGLRIDQMVAVRPTPPWMSNAAFLPNSANQGNSIRLPSPALVGYNAPMSVLKNQVNGGRPTLTLMKYPALLSILPRFLDRPKMDLLLRCYDDFQKNRITRIQLMQRTRQIAGDKMLIEIIRSNRDKLEMRRWDQ